MRKILIFLTGTLISGSLLAGGLVTNTNQSASWVRLPARNASTEVDAVYYNPAGLMKLENGFHFSLSNQSIFQTREITNSYTGPTVPGFTYGLNEDLYTGTVTALAFPSIYAVYKMEKLAISFGFNPVGGGGGAEYEKGLPSFEMSPSDLVPALSSRGATAYRLDAYFKGSSIFFGFQGGLSYKINDWLSVAAGLRYVTAKNTYEGYLRSIELNMGGIWSKASDVFTGLAAQLTGITTIPTQVQPFTSNPATQNMNLTQLLAVGLPAASKTSIEAALAAIGVPAANIPVMTITQISGAITTATPTLLTQSATATATSTLVADQAADVAQTGSGITPVFSVNISPSENINIAIKYELATKLELENETTTDLLVGYTATGTKITMFPNGAVTRNDMPAMLALGIDYRVIPALKISLGT